MINIKITMKRKASRCDKAELETCGIHHFSAEETRLLRTGLLTWYKLKGRTLPWREKGKHEKDDNVRGYSVLVSEIMLQQTQVATVISYYNKWMEKWPSTVALATATLEEVNQAWAGLGYYSRGRRLWEAARSIETELNGVVPRSSGALLKLPGVGRYTAAAVASIAYGERVGLVDGNVLRVLARMRRIGLEIDSPTATDWVWKLSEDIVDPTEPGDFNQALMELGATVCTPKSPSCSSCPVRSICGAVKTDSLPDIEDSCTLCLKDKFDLQQGVMNFPRKTKKAASREETTVVIAFSKTNDGEKVFAVQQRPKTGLLANLWELLSVELKDGEEEEAVVETFFQERKLLYGSLERKGELSHIFSHINMKYVVYTADGVGDDSLQYLSSTEFLAKGISTAMKKVMKVVEGTAEQRKRKAEPAPKDPKQRSISSFFKVKDK